MDGTYPSFASRVLASPIRYKSTSLFVLPNAAGSGLLARATSTQTEAYLPLSAGLGCCRVNLQPAISPMKQEKCTQPGGASDGHSLKKGEEYLLAGWLAGA